MVDLEDRIIQIIMKSDVLPSDASLADAESNLWDSGMDSLASVRLLVLLEDAFTVEFPDELLTRDTFSTVRRLASIIGELEREDVR
jgi:acyl carrier protein